MDRSGKETVLHTFSGTTDGGNPDSGLVRDEHGNLYGTTIIGGDVNSPACPAGCGVVFKLTSDEACKGDADQGENPPPEGA